MDQRTLNTLGRFNKIKRFLDENATVVASVGALAAAVGAYAGLMALLPKTAAADTSTEGATEDKGKSRESVIKGLLPLASALKLYYKKEGNLERARAMDITRPSKLSTMAALRFEGLAAKALEYVDELPASALAYYNQKAENLDAFRAAAAEFGIKKSLPTEARNANKTAADQLDERIDDTSEFVADDLKTAVNLVANTHPEFVRGFKQANKTDDTPGKQNKALRERNQQKRDEEAAKAPATDPTTPPIPPNGSGVGS